MNRRELFVGGAAVAATIACPLPALALQEPTVERTLPCWGQWVLPKGYPELFTVMGFAYGKKHDARYGDMFRLPDFRGYQIIAKSSNRGWLIGMLLPSMGYDSQAMRLT